MFIKIRNNKYLAKITKFVTNHKFTSLIIVVAVVFGSNYFWTKTHPVVDTKYVLGTVKKSNIVVSVSGTGQVTTENQIDLKAKASGEILQLNAKVGQTVEKGALIASLDARDAYISLQTAQIALDKLLKPADDLSVIQAQNNLSKAYDDGFNNVSSTFIDLPPILSGLYDLLFSQTGYLSSANATTLTGTAKMYEDQAASSYGIAKTNYDKALALYNLTSKSSSSKTQIEDLVAQTYETVRLVAQVVKDAKIAVDFLQDEKDDQNNSSVLSLQSNISSWTSKVNTDLATILASKASISDSKESLIKLQEGTDALDIQSAQLSLQQKQNAYQDYFIRAPFAGVVARIPVHAHDSVTSGTVIATIVTPQKFAEITLNEVDVVKVKTSQKATMTFDAINGLTATGEVAEVDSVGTEDQGVVTYNVKIKFDSNDERIRPGMSVTASIITDVHSDVITVPNSAIKKISAGSEVQVVGDADKKLSQNSAGVSLTSSPNTVLVETGLQNDSDTEIISGLNVGDVIILRTINGASTAKTTASAFSIPGTQNKSTGGAVRAISR
ncbi:MAG: HlyD family efflux transporter periplasmic adaptor subunit [Minisyncoccia bacterium]